MSVIDRLRVAANWIVGIKPTPNMPPPPAQLEVYRGSRPSLFDTVFEAGRTVQVWRNAGYWELGWHIGGPMPNGDILVRQGKNKKFLGPHQLLSANPHLIPEGTELNVRRHSGQLESRWQVVCYDEHDNLFQMRRPGWTKKVSLHDLLRENPGLLKDCGPQPPSPRVLPELLAPTDLIHGWAQGAEGNCSSVAVIKLAMKTYGPDIFSEVRKYPSGYYQIKMRDGVKVTVTPQDLDRTAEEAHFKRGFRGYPLLCFTAMAKRDQTERNRSLDASLDDLNNGHNPRECSRLLGLDQLRQTVRLCEVKDLSAVVMWSPRHAVFGENQDGKAVYDKYGDEKSMRETVLGMPAIDAFRFKPIR